MKSLSCQPVEFDTTCQFCYGLGESGFLNKTVEARKTPSGNYVPIKKAKPCLK